MPMRVVAHVNAGSGWRNWVRTSDAKACNEA